MQRMDILKKHRTRLIEEITVNLDFFLIGTVAKSPSMIGHGLTTKAKGKTVSLCVRKDIVKKTQEMTKRYKKVWFLMQKLSKVNWDILKLKNE